MANRQQNEWDFGCMFDDVESATFCFLRRPPLLLHFHFRFILMTSPSSPHIRPIIQSMAHAQELLFDYIKPVRRWKIHKVSPAPISGALWPQIRLSGRLIEKSGLVSASPRDELPLMTCGLQEIGKKNPTRLLLCVFLSCFPTLLLHKNEPKNAGIETTYIYDIGTIFSSSICDPDSDASTLLVSRATLLD